MEIYIKSSKMNFKAPQPGTPSKAIEEHFESRRIMAIVDGEDKTFVFKKNALPFNATTADMEDAIATEVANETQQE